MVYQNEHVMADADKISVTHARCEAGRRYSPEHDIWKWRIPARFMACKVHYKKKEHNQLVTKNRGVM